MESGHILELGVRVGAGLRQSRWSPGWDSLFDRKGDDGRRRLCAENRFEKITFETFITHPREKSRGWVK